MRMQSTEQNDDKVSGKDLQMSISESQLVAPLSVPVDQVEDSKSDINVENQDATSANQGNISEQVETATNNSEEQAVQPTEKDTLGILMPKKGRLLVDFSRREWLNTNCWCSRTPQTAERPNGKVLDRCKKYYIIFLLS